MRWKDDEFTMWEELFKYPLLTKQRTIAMSEMVIAMVIAMAEIAMAAIAVTIVLII